MKKIIALVGLALTLSACGNQQGGHVPNGVKVGKPYSVSGQTYYPEYDPHYDRTGMASWYGPGFHGKNTANGERFDQDELTAAHPTLPMPSLVRVTNLESGESAIVRINDRGPFKDNRLIDLSRASAKKLGVSGLARVRVQYLKDETEQYWANRHIETQDIQFAKNDPYAPDEDEGSRGGYDGVQVARDPAPQVKSSAPITSVASNDIKTEDLKFRPVEPRFRVVSDANAEEVEKPAVTREEPVPEEVRPPLQPKIVRLTKNGKPIGKGGKGEAKILHPQKEMEQQAEEAESEERIDTSSEAITEPPPPTLKEPEKKARLSPSSGAEVAKQIPEPAELGGKWFIQAGSFSSEENARKLANKLKNIAEVDQRPVSVSGQTWYRVRVGPFVSRERAQRHVSDAVAAGAAGARVIEQ